MIGCFAVFHLFKAAPALLHHQDQQITVHIHGADIRCTVLRIRIQRAYLFHPIFLCGQYADRTPSHQIDILPVRFYNIAFINPKGLYIRFRIAFLFRGCFLYILLQILYFRPFHDIRSILPFGICGSILLVPSDLFKPLVHRIIAFRQRIEIPGIFPPDPFCFSSCSGVRRFFRQSFYCCFLYRGFLIYRPCLRRHCHIHRRGILRHPAWCPEIDPSPAHQGDTADNKNRRRGKSGCQFRISEE